jgi:ADP-heptose:LPS heptosyltransferase
MKILVVSLLRLGDILLATSVLRSLKMQNKSAEIHVLINGQFKSVASLIPFVEKVYSFDRDVLQTLIGTPDHSLLEAYYRIEDLVEKLHGEKYDRVINLTHNRLSGWLTALVGCKETQGVVFSPEGKRSMGSKWFEYLNDHTEPTQENVFHFVDIFHYGAGVPSADRRIELKEGEAGKAFALKLFKNVKSKKIIIQPGTNELKKTFTSNKWRGIISLITQSQPECSVFVLGAPNENDLLQSICNGTSSTPILATLEEAFSVLNHADLLITGDTSIKHLASATKIKILEISLGSSEFRKTGAYTSGAIIIQGKVSCAPCTHRSPCSQKSHLCADRISDDMVALIAGAILRQDEGALRMLAHEFKEEAILLRTQINTQGDWAAYELANEFTKEQIGRWVDRASSKLFLEKVLEKQVGEFGTEGLELKSLLENIFPDQSWREWITELKEMEKQVIWFESQITNLLGRLKEILTQMDSGAYLQRYISELKEFCARAETNSLFKSYGRQISLLLNEVSADASAFVTVKSLRERLATAHQRTKIELKLIRGLQTGFMEVV